MRGQDGVSVDNVFVCVLPTLGNKRPGSIRKCSAPCTCCGHTNHVAPQRGKVHTVCVCVQCERKRKPKRRRLDGWTSVDLGLAEHSICDVNEDSFLFATCRYKRVECGAHVDDWTIGRVMRINHSIKCWKLGQVHSKALPWN